MLERFHDSAWHCPRLLRTSNALGGRSAGYRNIARQVAATLSLPLRSIVHWSVPLQERNMTWRRSGLYSQGIISGCPDMPVRTGGREREWITRHLPILPDGFAIGRGPSGRDPMHPALCRRYPTREPPGHRSNARRSSARAIRVGAAQRVAGDGRPGFGTDEEITALKMAFKAGVATPQRLFYDDQAVIQHGPACLMRWLAGTAAPFRLTTGLDACRTLLIE